MFLQQNKRLRLAAGVICLGSNCLVGQTLLDVGSQSKNVDFSSALRTKPFRTGPSLPTSCSTGEVFLQSESSGVFLCSSLNSWIQLGPLSNFSWSNLGNPTGNLSLKMGTFSTTLTLGSASGLADGFKVTDGAANGAPAFLDTLLPLQVPQAFPGKPTRMESAGRSIHRGGARRSDQRHRAP